METNPGQEQSFDQHIFLVGRPPLIEFVNTLKMLGPDAAATDEAVLTAEWRAANKRVHQLEEAEAGLADDPDIGEPPSELKEHVSGLLGSAAFKHFHSLVPTRIGIVELDRLVVVQKHVNLAYVEGLRGRITEKMGDLELFQFCLLDGSSKPKIKAGRVSSNSYIFSSVSSDLRFLDASLIRTTQIASFEHFGSLATAVVLVLGFGPNLVSAIHANNRLILHNGTHRAYALREKGITHIPCLIQEVSHTDTLEALTPGEFAQHSERYLTSPRPPLLKDYFDPQLRKVCVMRRNHRQIKVAFGIDAMNVPA